MPDILARGGDGSPMRIGGRPLRFERAASGVT
jgi:hypothetical protein